MPKIAENTYYADNKYRYMLSIRTKQAQISGTKNDTYMCVYIYIFIARCRSLRTSSLLCYL